jgi:hypothetical protein
MAVHDTTTDDDRTDVEREATPRLLMKLGIQLLLAVLSL